jgi:hypothetical protein
MEMLFIPITVPILVLLARHQYGNWRNGGWLRWSKSVWTSLKGC